jgi:flagellar hook assembly protein FlgD
MSDTVGPVASSGNIPAQFFINQNFPNPFIDTTSITYGVPSTGGPTEFVSVEIFDKYYNSVRTLAYNAHHPFGTFTVVWDGRDVEYKKVPPGIYIIEMYGSSPNTFISRIVAVRTK